MSKTPNYAKKYKNHKVIIIDEAGNLTERAVWNIDNSTIETSEEMLPISQAEKFYNQTTGGFAYIFNMDLPAKIEAENVKQLRRSQAIKNMMNYDREKPLDLFKLMPYVIAIFALMFA